MAKNAKSRSVPVTPGIINPINGATSGQNQHKAIGIMGNPWESWVALEIPDVVVGVTVLHTIGIIGGAVTEPCVEEVPLFGVVNVAPPPFVVDDVGDFDEMLVPPVDEVLLPPFVVDDVGDFDGMLVPPVDEVLPPVVTIVELPSLVAVEDLLDEMPVDRFTLWVDLLVEWVELAFPEVEPVRDLVVEPMLPDWEITAAACAVAKRTATEIKECPKKCIL
jgi:hypothetical protein